MTVYRFQRKEKIKYFIENIIHKDIKEKRKYISYFFTKKPNKKDLLFIHTKLSKL